MSVAQVSKSAARELLPGAKACFVHAESMTIAHWWFEPGALLPKHSHPHEQVTNLIEGQFELTVAEKVQRLTPGSVLVIPPEAVHSGKAVTATYIIDVFHPVREDYK